VADPPHNHRTFPHVHVDHTLMDVYLVDEHGQPVVNEHGEALRPVMELRRHKRSRTVKSLKIIRWEPMPSQSNEPSSGDSK
jgi:hypothetical protein